MGENKRFYLCILQFFALICLLAFLLWLILRPKSPTYTIIDITIPTSNAINTTGDKNVPIWYTLEVSNRNKDSSIYYDDIFLLFYHADERVGEKTTFYHVDEKVGEKTIHSFKQGKDSKKEIMDSVDISAWAWRALTNAALNATAQLKIDLVNKFHYRTWGIKSKHHGVKLHGKIPIGSNGKISGKKKKIKLHHGSKLK